MMTSSPNSTSSSSTTNSAASPAVISPVSTACKPWSVMALYWPPLAPGAMPG